MRLLQQLVCGYITALIDLYQAQKAIGINSHQSLQEDNIKEYLTVLQRRDMQRDKKQFIDKGRDTLLNGYTEDKFKSVCYKLQAHGGSLLKCYLRTLVDILLGHYMLTRGGNRRSAKILDLFTFKFKGEGPTHYIPLIFTTCTSKQNQYSRLKTIKALCNKKPLVYMLSRLAFYLLYYQDFSDEPFLNYSKQLI